MPCHHLIALLPFVDTTSGYFRYKDGIATGPPLIKRFIPNNQSIIMPNKGKGKAVNREREPLLGSSSRSVPRRRRDDRSSRLRSALLTAFVVLFSLLLSLILFVGLLAYSFRPSTSEVEVLPRKAFQYRLPENISILNVTEEGVYVNLTIPCGIDADEVLGIKPFVGAGDRRDAEVRGYRGTGAAWWENLRRWTARTSLGYLPDNIEVSIGQILVYPERSTTPILGVNIEYPIGIPMVANASGSWLQPLPVVALAKPIGTSEQFWAFVRQGWASGQIHVDIDALNVSGRLPIDQSWLESYIHVQRDQFSLSWSMPGLPWPGEPLNLSALVHLISYTFESTEDALMISAAASVPNILPQLDTTIPFGLPFAISIPSEDSSILMAEVTTDPIQLGGPSTRLELRMSGQISSDLHSTNGSSPLSLFLQNYLHGIDNPILVQGLNASEDPSTPGWLLHRLSSVKVPLVFPGPQPRPKVIERVSIEHMRISESSGHILASGVVVVDIRLPAGMDNVSINVNAVLPDVIVLDGAPDEDESELPARAFGHIRPEDFLAATSEELDGLVTVRAPLRDVPLQILEGRDSVFRSFARKVLFKGGAEAGILGNATVKVEIPGIQGELTLEGLPVRGQTWVGRGGWQ